ncbi:hypothetical protein ACFQOY_00480 [Enterococcus alcedinis]|uniref:Uncharacterized protein n=1 Tax=Enterococcus alcedinis TaxID=1274384 RepID=A0A917N3G0_9ENTE|nr:hypothetical protein [Enterococcus alcedinis]MBP2101046.1 hypothetical protein [Enterococcus alcedinis]GGI64655.1 hypothetical protein GCM10011482_03090 [Enterococcus alcedinis]
MKKPYADFFETEGISYKRYEHIPVYTIEQAKLLVFEEEILEIKICFYVTKRRVRPTYLV